MTDLRQAAQQALEAWDDPMGMKDLCVAMDALRTALEQQQAEPVAWMDREGDLYKMPEIKNWAPPHTMLYTTQPQQQAEPPEWLLIKNILDEYGLQAISFVAEWKAAQQQAEPVAWDVFELRLYGAPQEKQHRVLWVERYIYPDGSTPDLDSLLDAAKTEGGIDGRAKTLHVRPLYTTPPQRQWVGLTDEDFLEACQIAERGNYLLALQRIQIKLKERNNG